MQCIHKGKMATVHKKTGDKHYMHRNNQINTYWGYRLGTVIEIQLHWGFKIVHVRTTSYHVLVKSES